jgi:hypothetical protein
MPRQTNHHNMRIIMHVHFQYLKIQKGVKSS